MNRAEAIAVIQSKLDLLDDAELSSVADHVVDLTDVKRLRALSERELLLIEKSKTEFDAGQTYSLDEARALSDQMIAGWRAKYPTAP